MNIEQAMKLILRISVSLMVLISIISVLSFIQSPNLQNLLSVLLSIVSAASLVVTVLGFSFTNGGGFNTESKRLKPDEYIKDCQSTLEQELDEVVNKFVELPVKASLEFSAYGFRPSVGISQKRKYDSIEEVVETYHKFVLIGDPGAGKTIILRRIQLLQLKAYQQYRSRYDYPMLPLFINLGNSNNPPQPLELIKYWWKQERIDADLSFYIARKRIFLLLDGLNEMPDGFGKESLVNRAKELKYFLRDYGGPVVVTCRVADYNESLELDLPKVEVLRLGANQIRAFAVKHLDNNADTFVNEIIRPDHSERLALAQNPLALAMMIQMFREGEDNAFADNRKDLYNKYIIHRYDKNLRETRGKSRVKHNINLLMLAWGKLAYDMMLDGKSNNVEQGWAEKHAGLDKDQGLFSRRGKQYIDDALSLNLLIQENFEDFKKDERKSRKRKKVRFYHQTLYEHFALPLINLKAGTTKERIGLIERLGNLGKIALPVVPALAELFVDQADVADSTIYNATRSAIISIVVELKRREALYLVLSLLLDTAIRIHNAIDSGNDEIRPQLTDSVGRDLDNAFAKAFSDTLVISRADDLNSSLHPTEFLDETEALRAALESNDTSQQQLLRKINEANREYLRELAKTNVEVLRNARSLAKTLSNPERRDINLANKLIVDLAEQQCLMINQVIGIDVNTPLAVVENRRNMQQEILEIAHKLGSSG